MKFKKALSLVIALCMIMSLLPAVSAAEETAPEGTISYDFTSETFASRGVSGRQKLENKDAILASFKKYPKDAATPSVDPKDQWIYLGMNANYSGTGSSAPWTRIDGTGKYIITTMSWPTGTVGGETVGEGYLALQVYVPTPGIYDLSIDVDEPSAAGSENVDIYLGKTSTWTQAYFADASVKGTVSTITIDEDINPYTGAVCTANTNVIRENAKKFSELGIPESYLKGSGISLKYDTAKTINLKNQLIADTAGDYVFIIRNRDLNSSRITISGLTLTPAEGGVRDEAKDVTFDFDATASHGCTSNKLETRAGVPEKSCVDYPDNPSSAKDMWAYLGTNIASTGTKSSHYFVLNNSDPSYLLSATGVYGNWMALKVYVPATGSYNISGTVNARTDTSAAQEMYLIPESDVLGNGKTAAETFARPRDGGIYGTVALNEAGDKYVRTGAASFEDLGIASSYLISTSNTKNAENGVEMDLEPASGVYLKKGSHILLLRDADTASTDSSKKRIGIKTLTFAPMVTISADKEAIVDETEPTLSTKVYNINGFQMQPSSVEYTTEDTSVISISGNKITPLSHGEATITAKAIVGGKEYFGEYKISVTAPKTDKLAIVNVSLEDATSVPAYATRKVSVVLCDKYSVPLELKETPVINVWYESDGVKTEGIEDNGQWYITAPSGVSSIKLYAEATYKGETVTGSSNVEVINTDNDKNFVIDFRKQPITDPYAATLDEHGWEFTSWDIRSNGTVSLNLSGLTVTPRKLGNGVIKVKIPRSGYYRLSLSGNANGIRSAEDVDIYLDGVYAGDYSFYKNGTSKALLPEDFRTFYIEAGVHTLTFVCQPNSLMAKNPITGEMVTINDTRYGQPYTLIAFTARENMPGIKELVVEDIYNVSKGETLSLSASLLFEDGITHEIMPALDKAQQDYAISFEIVDGSEYIDLSDDGTVTAKEFGTANIKITATDKTGENMGKTWSETVSVNVNDYSFLGGFEITADSFVMRPDEIENINLGIKPVTISGDDYAENVAIDEISWGYDADAEGISFSENGEALSASIDENAKEGAHTVSVSVVVNGITYEAKATITVTFGKARRTYYTDERVANALENIEKYDWAKAERTSAVKAAEKYLTVGMEGMWNLVIGEGIPRAIRINRRGDNTSYVCRYCGTKVAESGYPWLTNPLNAPWKIQCPECKRQFPSNDFGSFYNLGLGNDGVFDRFLALARHHNMIYHPEEFAENHDYDCECELPEMLDPIDTTALFNQYGTELTNWYKYYGYGQGFLKNDLYTDLYTEGKELNGIDPYRYNADFDADGTPDRVIYNLVGGYDDVKSGMLWCVDDGWGYAPGNAMVASETVPDLWTFIPHYVHNGLWHAGSNEISKALDNLRLAYLYTGEEKYGKIGAVIIDRIADLYPEYSSTDWVDSTGTARNWNSLRYTFTDSSFYTGKITNDIWDSTFANRFALAYDAFWPMYDNPDVQKFLADKEAQYPGIAVHPVTGEARNHKTSNKNIRDNIEHDLIYEIYQAALSHDVNGNYGSHQQTIANAAVIYDREPATREMIDWVFAESVTNSSTAGKTFNTGGELLYKIVNSVSRDGQGTESSASYNYGWVEDTVSVATALGLYKGEISEKENLWRNPKYTTMLTCYNDMIDLHRGVQSVGDQGIMASFRVMPSDTNVSAEAYKQIGIYLDELYEMLPTVSGEDKAELEEKIEGYRKVRTEIAQLLYEITVKGKNFELRDFHYDIFTKNPESLYSDIEKEIKTYGEYNYDKSSMMTGYGYTALRDGALYREVIGINTIKDTTRDFWMYFGGALSHSHHDFLNVGIDAYGISLSSDNGYPEQTGSYPSRHQWTNVTLAHNTVTVNTSNSSKPEDTAKPLHFDDKDTRVKLVDVDGSAAYYETDDYRRTVLMIDYDDEISYGVDFFKVLGGEDHIYSFHASSNTISEVVGLDSIEHQVDEKGNYVGTYAGADVLFGNDPWTNPSSQYVPLKYPKGFTWLEKIRKDNAPDMNFSVDYKISDMQKLSRNPSNAMDIHLKVTTANDWTADEVTLAQSVPSRRDGWDKVINRIEYMLIRRKSSDGEKLDTLYTTVFEPYNKTPYIKSIDRIAMTPANGESLGTDKAAAVRVELVDGRIDYVVYATRNDILYTITDTTADTATEGYSFSFNGFAGVWTVRATDTGIENVYSYLHDGSVIGNTESEYTDAITGKVVWHTKGLSVVNKVVVEFDEPISDELLKALEEGETSLSGRLFVGETSKPGNAAYVIEEASVSEDGKTATLNFGNITLVDSYDSYKDDTYNYYITEGVTRFAIPMSYEENNAPSFITATEGLSATAGSSVSIALKAESTLDDGIIAYSARSLPRGARLDESGLFTWTPSASQVGENLVAVDAIDSLGRIGTLYFTVMVYGKTTGGTTTPSTPTTPNNGNAGGGGAGGGGASPSIPTTPSESEKEEVTVPETPLETTERFVDLGSHSWAKDAIISLADAGIIKGTSEKTFSPASNITRADFTILLVRAFKLTSENTENFADVAEGDYFAKELAIARNTGIVNGIGDNKYAPRNTITRQDMMTIVYRAMQKLDVEFGVYDEPQYDDFANVAEYAKDAVKALIGAGLVNGKSGKIAPADYTTRAEVAVLIERILNHTSK